MRRLAIVLPLVLFSACIDDAEQLGVALLFDTPAAVWTPCGGDEDEPPVVELLFTDQNNNPGGGDDRVLWRAEPREPSGGPFVTPFGVRPEGYETTIPLQRDLDPSTEYTLYIDPGGVIVFRPTDLKPGVIESESGPLTPSQFLNYAREGCGSGGLVDGSEPIVLQLEQPHSVSLRDWSWNESG